MCPPRSSCPHPNHEDGPLPPEPSPSESPERGPERGLRRGWRARTGGGPCEAIGALDRPGEGFRRFRVVRFPASGLPGPLGRDPHLGPDERMS